MQTRKRGAAGLAGLAVLAMVATACGGSSSGGGGPTNSTSPSSGSTASGAGFTKISTNSTGTPRKGGTLNVLGSGDVDYLDPNITYYSLGYSIARLFSRQLYSYPAESGHQTDLRADLATGMPQLSNGGKTVKVTIRQGAKWNTNPARQVSAADAVRGLKTTCNPVQPFGGLPDYENFIVGFKQFCDGFAKAGNTAAAIKKYMDSHNFAGASVDPSNPLTVVYKLTQPVTFFPNLLALPAFSPRAQEMENYVPASAEEAQHTVSDGPYQVQQYNPAKLLVFERNKAWDASTDPLRKAYVDVIKLTETNDVEQAQKQLQTNTASADLAFNGVPATDAVTLLAKNDPQINVESEIASNPYVLYNTVSPNNNGALKKVAVRQALNYALNRTNLIQDAGGPRLNVALTHVLPAQIEGSKDFDLYPHNTAKAQQMLKAAGATNLKLTFLYRSSSPTSTKMFQTVQADLKKVGVTVKGLPTGDAPFYTKYLQNPAAAERGAWDLSLAGWGPDWYGNAALSFFSPLFDGRVKPPSSSDFGLFNDPKVNSLIDQASTATDTQTALGLWQQADEAVMKGAAFFPIANPNEAYYHASQVHNVIYMPEFQTADFTNVWLEAGRDGG
ncbi:MAG TPA: ABC transporter substrate-binding protein [Mycobacteriales bacterium]|nr:ABC transporter substrate-binding protein [Mycobacteriales bacterium]